MAEPLDSPLFACEVRPGGGVTHWMAFDPDYGPESEAQVDWHRHEYGDAHVRGWKVGLPLPGRRSAAAKRQRAAYYAEHPAEVPENLVQVPEKPKSAPLQSGKVRNEWGTLTYGSRRPFVTASCASCGRVLSATRGGRKRQTNADYCSPACRQRAYRERKEMAHV